LLRQFALTTANAALQLLAGLRLPWGGSITARARPATPSQSPQLDKSPVPLEHHKPHGRRLALAVCSA